MENDRQEHRGGTGAILCGAAFVLVPLLYVLSFGPAARLWSDDCLPEGAFEMVFFPLVLAGEQMGWLGTFLDWYAHFWGG